MRRKCHTCLCWTCLNVCKCDGCKGKIESCEDYNGFRQLSIFEQPPKHEHQSVPRRSWQYYGLENKAYRKKLYAICQSGKYGSIIRQVAYQANKDIAEYLIKSVTQNKSYEKVEFDRELGRICFGKTDFYGIRRRFYYLLDLELKKDGIKI